MLTLAIIAACIVFVTVACSDDFPPTIKPTIEQIICLTRRA